MNLSRLNQFGLKPDAAAQIYTPRDVRNEIVGARFDQIVAFTDSLQHAAESITAFIELNIELWRELEQVMSGCQPGDSPADHDNALTRLSIWRWVAHGTQSLWSV